MATNKNDKLILKLKKEIEDKKLLLQDSKFIPVTNCNLELGGNRVNLHVATKDQLLLLIGQIRGLELALHDVLPNEKLIINSYSSTDWLKDLVSKFNSLNVSIEKQRLKALDSKLHNLFSVDSKVELEIDALMREI